MSANNYYGFAHGGTQYGNQYTPPPSAPAGYSATQYPPGAGPAAQGYGAPGAPPEQYVISGYTRPVGQVGVQGAQPQQTYYPGQPGGAQTYPAGISANSQKAAAAPAAPRPAATSTVYPTYSANTAGNAATTYAGFTQPAAASNTAGAGANSDFTNYDQAVYNAVSAYAQGSTGRAGNTGGLGFKRPPGNKMKGPRPPPKPQALHYCDVCKISCAGPQTYKEHLEGQKHKKKEAAAKAGTPVVAKGSPPGLRCELCDVTCTGNDAYAAHIRGSKHQKVLKLHTKLGKPIPSDNPTVVTSTGVAGPVTGGKSNAISANTHSNNAVSGATSATPTANGTKTVPPKINFLGPKSDVPFSFGAQQVVATSTQDFSAPVPGTVTTPATLTAPSTTTAVNVPSGEVVSKDTLLIEKDIQPVGQDYIEEVKSADGKIVSFNCKLCECRFNDPNAKEMHMKGRRHRLQYKKKVNPDLVVDVKPSSRQKKLDDRRSRVVANAAARRPHMAPPDAFPRCPPVPLLPPSGPRGFVPPAFHPGPAPGFFIPPLMRRSETLEDSHIMTKHSAIYPDEEELQAIQKIVSNSEKALKCVSDQLAELDAKLTNNIKKEENSESTSPTEADLQAHRILKGVMRVGHLAKGLLLKGDRSVELVVLCSEKPTLTLLNRVVQVLPEQLKLVAPNETYEVLRDITGSCVVIASAQEPKIEVTVTLTSPLLRSPGAETTTVQAKEDLLDKEKCLDALAALRHAKWFQARVTSLQSCVILIRIFREMCERVPEWASFPCWAIELLTEKIISSIGASVSPGDGLRLLLEAISSGIILRNSVGLLDPCEKEPVDVLQCMTDQQRNDVTAYCQKALRLISFRKIHEVLGMEMLPRYQRKSTLENSRKRRRNESAGCEAEDTEILADGTKKDKKDEGESESVPITDGVVTDGSRYN